MSPTRSVTSWVVVVAAYLGLVLAGPWCAVPIVELLGFPVCVLAEYLLIAGLAGLVCESRQVSLAFVAASAAMVAIHALVGIQALPWDWANPIAWAALPLAIAPMAARGERASRRAVMWIVAGVVLATLVLWGSVLKGASLLVLRQHQAPLPEGWPRWIALELAAAFVAAVCVRSGVARREPRGAAIPLTLLVASIPLVGGGLLVLDSTIWATALTFTLST